MRLGIPPTLTPGNAIVSAVSSIERTDIPRTLLLELNVMLMAHQWLKTLGDDDSTPSGQCPSPEHFIQTFDNQCHAIREKYAGVWDPRSEITFSALQIQIYSFVIGKTDPMAMPTTPMNANWEFYFAKTLTAAVRLVSSVSQAEDAKEYWPVFAKYHVMLAACISVYMAAITTDLTAKSTLLETSKAAITLLAGWSIFSKDMFARIGKHIATAVRRVEAQGSSGLLAIDEGSHKTPICSRMGTNIPYRLVWNAKHGKSPDTHPEVQQAMPLNQDVSTFQGVLPQVDMLQMPNVTQPFDLLFNGLDDMALFDGMNDSDFTDMLLDWQSLRGPIPGWA